MEMLDEFTIMTRTFIFPDHQRVLTMNSVTINQVSTIEKASTPNIPEALADFSLSELRCFCLLSEQMLAGLHLTEASKKVNLGRKERDRFESIHRAIEEKLGLKILIRVKGSCIRYNPEPELVRRLRHIRGCIEKAIQDLQPIGEMRRETSRPMVRIASVLSVVSYLGPALIDKVNRSKNERDDRWPPSIAFHNGEFEDHIRNLNAGNLDLCIAPEDVPIPVGLTSTSLNFTPMELGLVFRLRNIEKGKPYFEKLESALLSGASHRIVRAAIQECVCLMQWEFATGHDERARSVNDFFCAARPRVTLGPRIYVPTMRSLRQLVCRGLAIGVGHKPRLEGGVYAKLQQSITEIGGFIGYDPDFPRSSLAYLPLNVLSTEDFKFPESKSGSYKLVFSGINRTPNPGLSHETIAVKTILEDMVANPFESAYLKWDKKSGHLLQDFHWGGQDDN